MPRSAKTETVMSLITGEKAVNSDEKKEKRRKHILTMPLEITPRGGAEPLNPALKAAFEAGGGYTRPRALEYQIVNASATLVGEQLGAAIERFRVCSCDRCCAEITARALRLLPTVFIHVRSAADEQAANEQLDRLRPEVVKVLARVIISAKKNPIH